MQQGPPPMPITPWRLLLDIRTERMIRYSAVYMSVLSCYFYWNNRTIQTPLGAFSVDSTTYWSILLVMGCVPIGTHYSMGFHFLAMQALVIATTISGLILIPTVPAMKYAAWAGYVVVAAAFVLLVGPPYVTMEPAVLHFYAMACAIVVEFIYTPSISDARSPDSIVTDFFTIDHLWSVSLQSIMVNIGMYCAIVGGAMLLPPWRTARAQLHQRAAQVLRLLEASFRAAGEALAVPLQPGEAARPPLPPMDQGLLLPGLVPTKDSLLELAPLSMLEPSFLHPGTLSALPDAWKVFVDMLQEVQSQAELLHRAAPFLHSEEDYEVSEAAVSAAAGGEAKTSVGKLQDKRRQDRGEVRARRHRLAAAAADAAGGVAAALARCLELERRGAADVPALDHGPAVVGGGMAGAAGTSRAELRAALQEAVQKGVAAVHALGSELLAEVAAAAPAVLAAPAAQPPGGGEARGVGGSEVTGEGSGNSAAEEGSGMLGGPGRTPGQGAPVAEAAELGQGEAGPPDGLDGWAGDGAAAAGAAQQAGERGALEAGGSAVAALAAAPSSEPGMFSFSVFVTLSIVMRQAAAAAAAVAPPAAAAQAATAANSKGGAGETAPLPEAGSRPAGWGPHGLGSLMAAVSDIERQLQTASVGNVVKQLLINLGPLQMASIIKAWIQGLLALLRLPFSAPWRLEGTGSVWRQPIHAYYAAQFAAGVWALLAATTYWNAYRTWENTDGHGATWPLMGFLLVLQPTQEGTIQKALMRLIATCVGVLLAWGLFSASSAPQFLIPISGLVIAPAFWLLPDSRSCVTLRTLGDLQYVCISYTFAYTLVMAYSGSYGAHATVVTRLGSQVLGCVIAILACIFIFPVSGTASATAAADEALACMEDATCMLADALQQPPPPFPATAAAAAAKGGSNGGGSGDGSGGHKQEPGRKHGGPGKGATQGDEGGASVWGEVHAALARSEGAVKLMSVQLASVRAYPLVVALASGTQGARLQEHLVHTSTAVPRKLALLRYICSDVQQLHAVPEPGEPTATNSMARLRAVVAEQLQELGAALQMQRQQLRAAFHARRRLLPLPYMPVHFRPIREDLVGKDPSDAAEQGGGNGVLPVEGDRAAAGTTQEQQKQQQDTAASTAAAAAGSPVLSASTLALQHRLQQGLREAVRGRAWAEVEAELSRYLAGGTQGGTEGGTGGGAGGGWLAEQMERFGLSYYLYTARLTSVKVQERVAAAGRAKGRRGRTDPL